MASRRPPLFELLQQDDGPRQGRNGAPGRSGVLSGGSGKPGADQAPPEAADRQASGAVESKPSKKAPTPSVEEIASPAEPVAKPKPAPKPRAERAQAEPKPQRPAGAADWSSMHPQSAVRVRMLWVYGAVIAVLAMVVVVWAIGYNLGERNQRAQLGAYLDRAGDGGAIRDPLEDTGEVDGSAVEAPPLTLVERPEEGRQAERTPVERPSPPVVESEPEPAPAIDVLVDVRQPNHNYMKLASGMDLERAQGLAQYLTDNGVHAMALREGRRGYGLYTALAVPSERFSAMEGQRREHADRVVRLLERAPRDMGGPYDARGHLWIRFDG